MNIVDSSLWLEYFFENDIDSSIIDVLKDSDNLYVPVININPQLAILAAQLGKQYKLPMADSIIYATAVLYDAEIYTQDKHFENLDRVQYFTKN